MSPASTATTAIPTASKQSKRRSKVESKTAKSKQAKRTLDPSTMPTDSPTFRTSTEPTLTNCTCENRLTELILQVSARVDTVDELDDPNSPQSKASEWILEECDADVPIDPCTESQIGLIEQRYALAVMYFSLGGDGWNTGSNPSVDKDAGNGVWLSGRDYCNWGTEITGQNGHYNQIVCCNESGNLLNLNLRELRQLLSSRRQSIQEVFGSTLF